MAKVHIGKQLSAGRFQAVIHYDVPTGNNSAGKSWQDCIAAGNPTTVLEEGTGVGQITTAEKADVESGAVVEIVYSVLADSGGALLATVNALVAVLINNDKDQKQFEFKYFGYEIAS
jgi:hypothetical protein